MKKNIVLCASHQDRFAILLLLTLKMMEALGKKRKRQQRDVTLSAEETHKLETVIYHYGGEEMILRTKQDTPVEVLWAYHKLNQIYGPSTQCLSALSDRERQKTMTTLKTYCFQFIQNTFTGHAQWNPLNRQCIGGGVVRCNGAQVSSSIPPAIDASSINYHSQWMALVRKVQVLLQKHDKTMKKAIDCKCNLNAPLV